MSSDFPNLKLIILGCRSRNQLSQFKLYEHFYGYGMSIVLRYCSQEPEAMEVLNDGFLKVFKKIEYYNDDFPFKLWLRRILINTAIDYYRKKIKEPMHLNLVSEDYNFGAEMPLPEIAPEADLLPIVQQLPTAYRMVFNLYVMEEYKHHEIAEMLDISVGTSKSNLARAKNKLRELLARSITQSSEQIKSKAL